jgi:hypothetical protein
LARPAVTDCAAYLNLWFNSSQHGQQYFSECIYGAGRPTSASISSAPRLSRCLRSGSSSRSLPGSIGCSQLRTTYRTASTLRRVVLSEAHRQSSRRPSAETLSHEAYLTMETGNRPKLSTSANRNVTNSIRSPANDKWRPIRPTARPENCHNVVTRHVRHGRKHCDDHGRSSQVKALAGTTGNAPRPPHTERCRIPMQPRDRKYRSGVMDGVRRQQRDSRN